MPTLQLEFSYIGGPEVSFKSYIEVKGDVDKMSVVILSGMEASLGGTFYLELGGYKILEDTKMDPVGLLSMAMPIAAIKNWNPPSISGSGSGGQCPNIGGGMSCDDWMSLKPDALSCKKLIGRGYECSGCECCSKTNLGKTCDELIADYPCENILNHFKKNPGAGSCSGCGIDNTASDTYVDEDGERAQCVVIN